MLYLAATPDREGHRLNEPLILAQPNQLARLLPAAAALADGLRVIDAADAPDQPRLLLNVDSMTQRAICYYDV